MKEKKKMAVWKKVIIIIAVIILLLLAGLAIYVNAMLNKINRPAEFKPEESSGEAVTETVEEFETDESAGEDTIKPEDVEWPEDVELEDDKNIINILLIGQDRRPGQGRQRSDSMMVATINKKNKTVSLTSILRDSYVQIPGYKDNRINAAYAFGGMELLDETIERNFGIHIDANIEVDFDGFKTVIDRIDGIDIELKDYEAEYFNKITNSSKYSAGLAHFTGEEALMYARTRYVGRSDFERTERQRRVMTTAFAKIKDSGAATILGLVDELFPCLTTDLSNMQIISYATSIIGMNLNEIQTYRIPADGAYSNQTIRGMMVLVPNLNICRQDFQNIIYGQGE